MTAIKITKENFDKEVNHKGLIVLDFWASWCGPCQAMTPIFEQLSGEYEGKVKFGKVNVDEEREIASAFNISGIPSISFIKSKEEIDRMVGFSSKENLKRKISSHI
jgi:thioredoxin 1